MQRKKVPTVSVVIPTYNRSKLLREALGSVLEQTYKDLEVIIVDDCSSEQAHLENAKTKELDNRVRYMYRRKNGGVAAARNDGIQMARGRYVAFLDDDNVWSPQKLEKQVQLISLDEDLAVVCSDIVYIDSKGKHLDQVSPVRSLFTSKTDLFKLYSGGRPWYRIGREKLYETVLYGCVLPLANTALVKRKCLVNVGLFDERLSGSEDWDLLIRLALCYHFGYIHEALAHVRVHSQHRITDNTKLMCESHIRLFDKIYRAVPDRLRGDFDAHAYQLYFASISSFLIRGDFSAADKIYRAVPDRLRGDFDAHAYQLYFPIISSFLIRGDFSAADSIIYRLALVCGFPTMLRIIVRLVVSSPLTAIQSIVRPADEKGPKAAVSLAIRRSLRIAVKYRCFRKSSLFDGSNQS